MEDKPKEKNTVINNTIISENNSGSDTRSILILVGVSIALFLVVISGFALYNNLTGAVVTDTELHKKNLNGELNENEGYIYNGYSFIKADGLWWTEMNKFGTLLKVPLHFSPRELENIQIKGDLDPAFNEGDNVYIAIDLNVADKHYTLAISELSFNLAKGMDRIPVGSCTEENSACEDRDIITCETANGKPVVELIIDPLPRIEIIGTCIKISGTGFDLVKGVNRLLYQWYGIMN